jgi:hypothetical protein
MDGLHRRDFIRAGTLGATGASLTSEPASTGATEPLPVSDMDEYLSRIDAGMERIAQWSPSSEFPGHGGDSAAIDSLARKSLRTLFMTGMFADLPVEGQVHPGAQDRIWAAMPEMDEASEEMTAFLRAQRPEDLQRVQETLRSQPELRQRIGETLDREAERCGVSEWRRRQMQVILGQEGWRLEHQPPALVVDEYLTKIEKVSATDVTSQARQTWLSAKVSERVFWEDLAGDGPAPPPQARSLRSQRIRRGAKLMGIAILIGGAGGIAVAIGSDAAVAAGAVLLTVGAIVFLVALIILLVGLATSSTAVGQSKLPVE